MINRKKKQVYSEVEELLSDNKKALEIFQHIQKREKQNQKITLLIIACELIEVMLGIIVFGFCLNVNPLTAIPFLIIIVILFFIILYLSEKRPEFFFNRKIFSKRYLKRKWSFRRCRSTFIRKKTVY